MSSGRKPRSKRSSITPAANDHVSNEVLPEAEDDVIGKNGANSAESCNDAKRQIIAMMGYEGARHVITDYLRTSRTETVVGMRLPDLSQRTTDFVRDLHDTLKRIDLSGFQLTEVPEDLVSDLDCLSQLDLSGNRLTELSLPASSPCLSRLVEIIAHNNSLSRAFTPDVATQLTPSLRRLNLANNRLTSFDGLERLTNLEMLILDDNSIDSINSSIFSALYRLQVLHCARNTIAELPTTVSHLRCLRDMDLSHNLLATVPPELIALPRIEAINLSGNAISRIPTIRLPSTASRYSKGGRQQQQLFRRLSVVDLSDNVLVKFPEQLLSLVQDRLDLSGNKIKVVPLSLERKLWSRAVRYGGDGDGVPAVLNMDDNPVVSPPEDVCRCGMRAILSYLNETKAQLPTYQGLKVLVIGSTGQGKTSLVQTLIDEQPTLTGEDRTIFIDTSEYTIDTDYTVNDDDENNNNNNNNEEEEEDSRHIPDTVIERTVIAAYRKQLTLSIWDMSGNERYSTPLWFFVESQALVLIVFSLAEYDEQRFGALIGNWIDLAIGKSNRLVCVIVGTHADCVDAEKVDELKRTIIVKINNYLGERSRFLDVVIRSIESLPHIDAVQSEHLKHCLLLKKSDVRVYSELICVSSLHNTGFDDLVSVVRRLGQDSAVFPLTLRRIPALWDDVEQFVETLGEQVSPPVLPWVEYERLVVDRFGLKRALSAITQYLHDTSKVIWFSKHDQLSKYVILRPSWLIEALRCVLRNNQPLIDDATTSVSVNGRQSTTSVCGRQSVGPTSRLDKLRTELVKYGIVETDYLKFIWNHLTNSSSESDRSTGSSSGLMNDLTALIIDGLRLGYPLSSNFVRDGVPSRPPLNVIRSSSDSFNSCPGVRGSGVESSVGGFDTPLSVGDPQSITSRCRFLVTCLRRVGRPRTFQEEYNRHADKPSLAAVYQFPLYAPTVTLFDRLTVRLAGRSPAATVSAGFQSSSGRTTRSTTTRRTGGSRGKDSSASTYDKTIYFSNHRLVVVYHWQLGFYAYDQQYPVRVYIQRGRRKDGVSFIRIEARLDSVVTQSGTAQAASVPTDVVEDLWAVLLPILNDIDSLITSFAGVYVERRMECPLCHNASFHGSWQTPKQLQSVPSVKCQTCDESVATALLIQPKEKRTIDQFLQMLAAQEEHNE